MAKRDNHYEAAFEAWLAWLGRPYIAIDESERARVAGYSLKSLDYIVASEDRQGGWLVDVKGRHFPTAGKQFWRNWSTQDELESLARWEQAFGLDYSGLLVFAYQVVGEHSPLPANDMFAFRGSLYGFVAMRLDHYASWAHPLSERWGTVTVNTPRFLALARPAIELLGVRPDRCSAGAA